MEFMVWLCKQHYIAEIDEEFLEFFTEAGISFQKQLKRWSNETR